MFPGVTILLSLTVFLNLVAEKMPTTSDAVPLIGRRLARRGTSLILGGPEPFAFCFRRDHLALVDSLPEPRG